MSKPFLKDKVSLTTSERDALGDVQESTMIYNKTLSALQIFVDGAWKTLVNSSVTDDLATDILLNTTDIATPGNVVNCYHQLSFTAGGSFTSGSWRTRSLNTITPSNSGWASISSNRLTLQPGRYILNGWGIAWNVGEHMMAVYDYTNSTYIQYGPRMANTSSSVFQTNYIVPISLNISTTTQYELRHRCTTTRADGFGYPVAWTSSNRYCGFNITKLT